MVECQLPKLDVVGSSPISRSIFICPDRTHRSFLGREFGRQEAEAADRPFAGAARAFTGLLPTGKRRQLHLPIVRVRALHIRRRKASPASPNPNSIIVEGSGTAESPVTSNSKGAPMITEKLDAGR